MANARIKRRKANDILKPSKEVKEAAEYLLGQKNIPDEYKPFVSAYLTYQRKVQEYCCYPTAELKWKLRDRVERLEEGWIDLQIRGYETFKAGREAQAARKAREAAVKTLAS